MRLLGERLLPVAAALIFLLLLMPSAASQTQNLEVAGLEAENVNTSFASDEIRFSTSYMNQSLSPKQVFVPSVLEDDLDAFTYSLQSFDEGSWPGVEAQLYLQIQYGDRWSSDYPTSELSTVLGNNQTETGNLTPHQYIYDNSVKAYRANGTGSVFDIGLSDGPTRFDINVKAHYEHLIIEYEVLQNVSVNGSSNTTEKVLWSYEDVYSGNDTELLTTGASFRREGNRAYKSITYDNLYEPKESELVYFVTPEKASIKYINFNGLQHKQVQEGLDTALTEAKNTGIDQELIIEDTKAFNYQVYNVTFPENSNRTIGVNYAYNPQVKVQNGDKTTFRSPKELYTYVIGSASVIGTTSYSSWGSYNYTIPDNTDLLNITLKGAGGSDGADQGDFYGGDGASGGEIKVQVRVNSSENLTVNVGQAGQPNSGGGGAGGGATSIKYKGNFKAVAGGGGGGSTGGDYNGGGYGGDGGDGIGQDGEDIGEGPGGTGGWGIGPCCGGYGGNSPGDYSNGNNGAPGSQKAYNDAEILSENTGGGNSGSGTVSITAIKSTQSPQVEKPVVRPSSVSTGSEVNVSVNVSDSDSSIEAVNVSMLDAAGNVEVDKAAMTNNTEVDSEYYYSFTIPKESSDVGEWTATVYATDNESATGSNSTTFDVTDGLPPHWFNFTDNATDWITGTTGATFSVKGRDNETGVRNITLATNETGQWRNSSSATFDNITDTKVEASFNWSNDSFTGTLGAKAYIKDAAGNTNVTSVETVNVDSSPPQFFDFGTNVSKVLIKGNSLNISTELRDNHSGLSKAFLATNETGTWKNRTDDDTSNIEKFSNTTGERELADFTWQNESFEGNLGYRIWAKDATGNWNSTKIRTIEVAGTITEEISDSAQITDSTSSYGDFFGKAFTDFSLTEEIDTAVSENVFLQSVFNMTASTVEDVEVSEAISSQVTLSLDLVSFTSAEDRQDTNVDVDHSTQGQGEVSDTASATFNPSAEVEVLGVNASSVLDTAIDLNSSRESQGFVIDTVSTTVSALTQTFSETAVNSSVNTIVDILGTTDSQASANGTASSGIQVNEITSSTATTTLELFTPLTVTTTAKGQGTATSQVSTDIGFSTDLASQVTGTGVVSTVIDVTEICWAGSPCYQDITGNQTQQDGGGTGIIDGEGPLTIIKPVPIPAKSVPEWMQIYYQQHRNKIHGFALFLIAATGFLTLRKIARFIL